MGREEGERGEHTIMCALCQHTIAQKQCRVSTARDGNVEPTPRYTTVHNTLLYTRGRPV